MAGAGAELNKIGMGSLTFWGSTPAYNLLEESKESGNDCPSHILLLGPNDARHILKTMANLKNSEREIHLYIVEGHPILLARQLLFLHLATLPLDKLGLHEKTTQFMETFGNILIRPQTKKTIRKACQTLIRLVTDKEALEKNLPIVNLEELKYRDRDAIVECFKYWAESDLLAVEVQEMWKVRLCQHLGTRYDTRLGVFDWDYHMRVIDKNKETKIIHPSEYKTWRNGGQAFNEYESDYNQANPTYYYAKNQPFQGDLLVGPFISYGIKSDDQSYFEMSNNQYKKKSSDITFHNLEEIFGIISPKSSEEQEGLVDMFKNLKIHFLPLDTCENLWMRSKFIGKFDRVFVSSFMGHKLKSEMVKLLKVDAIVVVDRSRYIWYFRQENDLCYEKKLLELADAAGLKLLPSIRDGEDIDQVESKDENFLKFRISTNNNISTTTDILKAINVDDKTNDKASGDF